MDAERENSEKEKNAKAVQHFAALAIGFVCVVIGIPLWWKTTQVYRVQLRYSDISTLSSTKIHYKSSFTIIVFEEAWDDQTLSIFGEKLRDNYQNIDQSEDAQAIVKYQGNIRRAYEEEKKLIQKALTLEVLDESLHTLGLGTEHGRYLVAILPRSSTIIQDMTVGSHRVAYMKAKSEPEQMFTQINNLLRSVFVDEAAVLRSIESASGARHYEADKESMRAVRYHPAYDITFTLLNPQPDILGVTWDIKPAIQKYLGNVLQMFEGFTDLNVKSQYLHYTSLYVKPRKDAEYNASVLHADDLPHIVNPIDSHLSSHISTNPNLNFVLYIPTRDQSPLYIIDSKGEKLTNNAFLSPRWGGIVVLNLPHPAEGAPLPVPVVLDMDAPMATFVSQLRLLLGVNTRTKENVNFLQLGERGIAEWEYDMWLRVHAVENLASATLTLNSLVQLLEEVANIVINDNIGKEVERAVVSLHQTHAFLQQGKLKEAFLSSRQAILSSEKAFFDQSLLELLYFPEDQKFAIYIPLFLPVSIPVLMSIFHAAKWIKAMRTKDTKQHQE